MTFTLLPAVDVSNGQAIRLSKGDIRSRTDACDPLEAALAWQNEGAEWVHLVDIDAAFGTGSNAELLASVVTKLDTKVELSGGIVDDDSLNQALSTGAERIVIGTTALQDRAWCSQVIQTHGDRLAVALDIRIKTGADGSRTHELLARGGSLSGGALWDALAWLEGAGCCRYVVTDVTKDGMLNGPNLELYQLMSSVTTAPVIASGGVSSIADLVALAKTAALSGSPEGAIVGKALYAGRFTLVDALESVRNH